MPPNSAAINVHFLGGIDPKPNQNGKNKCFLDTTHQFGEDRMTHHKLIKKSFEKRAPN